MKHVERAFPSIGRCLVAHTFRAPIRRPSRRWAERRFANIHRWNEPELGGHFAAFGQPNLSVQRSRSSVSVLAMINRPTKAQAAALDGCDALHSISTSTSTFILSDLELSGLSAHR